VDRTCARAEQRSDPFGLHDSETAPAERAEVDRHLIGTPEKAAALIPMKRAELAARNVEGGYWIAAAEPSAADHARTGVSSCRTAHALRSCQTAPPAESTSGSWTGKCCSRPLRAKGQLS